jgi:hypothetical protein
MKKSKGIENPEERKEEILVQRKKSKGIENPVERKEETPVQRKKGKIKATKKPDDVEKTLPMQVEEETEKKPIEIVHVTDSPDSETFKRLIRQLRDARK